MTRSRKALSLAGLAVAALAAAAPATAQDDAVARCRAEASTDAERIACLEAALRGDAASAAPAAPATAPAEAATEERRGLLRMPRLPFAGGGGEEAPASTGATVASTSSAAESFGAEEVRSARERADEEATPRMHAMVVNVSEVPYRRLEVELDNGQVWRQRQSEEAWNFAANPEPTEVEIYRSRFGGYRMKLVDRRETLSVERVR